MKARGLKSIVAVGVVALVVSGCQSWQGAGKQQSDAPAVDLKVNLFDFDGMPGRDYLVGGGYFISYRAAVEGDLYLADDYGDRLLATISLQPGEKHEIIYDVNDEQLSANLQALGIDPKKAVFKLYFVPR